MQRGKPIMFLYKYSQFSTDNNGKHLISIAKPKMRVNKQLSDKYPVFEPNFTNFIMIYIQIIHNQIKWSFFSQYLHFIFTNWENIINKSLPTYLMVTRLE
ncbi:MAG: hypothetical protein CVU39_01560 [Chloroflexi bacterium HGW-Chloroflexi-10]|nr:MAG: hypothetical protein CVU39_01560 [Chloroflexi bacterium HGW-Chloroflexi-10]